MYVSLLCTGFDSEENQGMRKRIIDGGMPGAPAGEGKWIDLEPLARVELTSEDPEYPVEGALSLQGGAGWCAQHPGRQTLRLLFDEPLRISRIHLVFQETQRQRTQEFLLRWSPDAGASWQEIVRQQYNFSPPDSRQEIEEFAVDIHGLTLLELVIIPDISGGEARASLARLRLA